MLHISDDERRRRLGERHRLVASRRTNDVTAITDSLVALHSSDPVSVYLSALARMTLPSVDAVDAALYADRTLIRHHAMRRTIWVMPRATTVAANASSTRKVAASERRKLLSWLAASDGISDPAAWLDEATRQVLTAVRQAGTISTRELGVLLPHLNVTLVAGAGTRHATPIAAHTRIPLLAAFDGLLVRARPIGGWTSAQYTWATTAQWVEGLDLDGPHPPVAQASADLAARLLQAYGPVTTTDLQWWTGWTKSQTVAAIAAAGAVEVRLDGDSHGWIAPGDDAPAVDGEWVALLPSLDPTAMGWKQRHWHIDDDVAARVFDRWGNAGPTVWVDGRIAGGWAQRPDGEVALDLMRDVGADQRTALGVEAERLAGAVGDTRFTVRFPSPSTRSLLGD